MVAHGRQRRSPATTERRREMSDGEEIASERERRAKRHVCVIEERGRLQVGVEFMGRVWAWAVRSGPRVGLDRRGPSLTTS